MFVILNQNDRSKDRQHGNISIMHSINKDSSPFRDFISASFRFRMICPFADCTCTLSDLFVTLRMLGMSDERSSSSFRTRRMITRGGDSQSVPIFQDLILGLAKRNARCCELDKTIYRVQIPCASLDQKQMETMLTVEMTSSSATFINQDQQKQIKHSSLTQ